MRGGGLFCSKALANALDALLFGLTSVGDVPNEREHVRLARPEVLQTAEGHLHAHVGRVLAMRKEIERLAHWAALTRSGPLRGGLEIVDQVRQAEAERLIVAEAEQIGRGRVPEHDLRSLRVGDDDGITNAGEQPARAEVEP